MKGSKLSTKINIKKHTVNAPKAIVEPVFDMRGLVYGGRVAERVGLVHRVARSLLQREQVLVVIDF